MRGAAFLCRVTDAVVVVIGGTTTDVGVLRKRFPREASTAVRVGGVRTNFRMPDVHSVGLGGGSYVRKTAGGRTTVGPLSAGYNLMEVRGVGVGVGKAGWGWSGGESGVGKVGGGGGGGGGGNHVLMFKDNVGKTSERLVGAHIGFSERTDTTFS